jgi:hypothetical protein
MNIYPTHTCFDDALDYLALLAKQRARALPDHRLVHGVCLMDNKPFAHAWVECGDEAIGSGVIQGCRVYYFVRRREYYRYFQPQMMTKYTALEAMRENYRTGHYGPWESYYRNMICG